VSATFRLLAVLGGILLLGVGGMPLFLAVFGAPVDPLKALVFGFATAVLTIAVVGGGIALARRARRSGRSPVPFDAAAFGVCMILIVLGFVVGGPLTTR